MITQAELHEIFYYQDGNLIYKKKRWKGNAGQIAGSLDGKGYLRIRINWVRYSIHRLIWLYHYGKFPKKLLDHIDGNRLNNKIENLREASYYENNINCVKQSNNTSGYKNITWNKEKQKWQVKCNSYGKKYHAGYFVNLNDAIEAAVKLREKVHGNFAKHC